MNIPTRKATREDRFGYRYYCKGAARRLKKYEKQKNKRELRRKIKRGDLD